MSILNRITAGKLILPCRPNMLKAARKNKMGI